MGFSDFAESYEPMQRSRSCSPPAASGESSHSSSEDQTCDAPLPRRMAPIGAARSMSAQLPTVCPPIPPRRRPDHSPFAGTLNGSPPDATRCSMDTATSSQRPPHDVNSLKAAVLAAEVGTGSVRKAILSSTFKPGAAAFTSLLNMCSKMRNPGPAWRKALEIYDTLKYLVTQTNSRLINTITYSALISCLGNAGQWQEALRIYGDMEEAAKEDRNCEPNLIAYSALISALEKGGQLGKALEVFKRMQEAGVEADVITFSVLIQACERANNLEMAVELLETMHKAGLQATPAIYKPIIGHLMKLRGGQDGADVIPPHWLQPAGHRVPTPPKAGLGEVLAQLQVPKGSPVDLFLQAQQRRIDLLEFQVAELRRSAQHAQQAYRGQSQRLALLEARAAKWEPIKASWGSTPGGMPPVPPPPAPLASPFGGGLGMPTPSLGVRSASCGLADARLKALEAMPADPFLQQPAEAYRQFSAILNDVHRREY